MEMIMCCSCGEFTPASVDDDTPLPVTNACPDCGETEFKDIDSGQYVRTD